MKGEEGRVIFGLDHDFNVICNNLNLSLVICKFQGQTANICTVNITKGPIYNLIQGDTTLPLDYCSTFNPLPVSSISTSFL